MGGLTFTNLNNTGRLYSFSLIFTGVYPVKHNFSKFFSKTRFLIQNYLRFPHKPILLRMLKKITGLDSPCIINTTVAHIHMSLFQNYSNYLKILKLVKRIPKSSFAAKCFVKFFIE